jgi:hypothetical protein
LSFQKTFQVLLFLQNQLMTKKITTKYRRSPKENGSQPKVMRRVEAKKG